MVISLTDSQLDAILDGRSLIIWGHQCGKTELQRQLVERWVDRLRAGCAALSIGTQDAQAWCDAYLFIQLLRLRLHQEGHGIDPDKLNGLDKRILREAFRQARKLQVRLAQVVRE